MYVIEQLNQPFKHFSMKRLTLLMFIIILAIDSKSQVTSFEIDSSKFNKPLMATLDSLYQNDQTVRYDFLKASKNKASKSVLDSFLNVMRKTDQENLRLVKEIIRKYGWLGPQHVGLNASQGMFLVIQHADLATQELYLPIIRSAEKDGHLLSSNLAILEDRILMRKGLKQIYGSQTFNDKLTGKIYFYPIEKPDQLEVRRKSMGLVPMAEYANVMNMDWDLAGYKKMLPELELITARKNLR